MNSKSGFTLIELIIVLGVTAIIYLLSFLGAYNTVPKNSLDNKTQMLVAHLKEQQIKAMSGSTEGDTASDNYGIYFTDGKYVLFKGNSYLPDSIYNYTVAADDINFSTSIGDSIVFLHGSGQIKNLSPVTVTLTQKNIQQSKVISLNKYGVIESIF